MGSRGVRLVLGFSPGSLSDHIRTIPRDALAEQLGAPVTIELKPGHNGIPAPREVVESKPDGATAFHGDAGHACDRTVSGAASGRTIRCRILSAYRWYRVRRCCSRVTRRSA